MLSEPDLFTSVGRVHCDSNKISSLQYNWDIRDNDKHSDAKDSDAKNSDAKNSDVYHDRIARKWYLTVIVLLYVGLIASFCLNISLLIKTFPQDSSNLGLEYPTLYQG